MEKLKAAQQEVTKDSAQSCFEAAKVGFDRQREVLVQTEEAAGAALEHAFDFMEQAFENGEEMVVFVTGSRLRRSPQGFSPSIPASAI